MGRGLSPPGSVLRMAAPLVVSFWMRAAVTFVDTIYAAFIGDEAVAAVGLTLPFEFLMIGAWIGLSTGVTSGLSRALGAGEGAKIDQYLAVGRRATLVLAPCFAAVGVALWFAAPHLGLVPAVWRSFRLYGTVLIAGSAFTTFWSINPDSLVKAHHDTRSTMWAGIWTNGINIGLNTLFLFVFHWGVFGIALSTVLGRIGGLAYALGRARFHERLRRAGAASGSPATDPTPYRSVLGLAVPSALTFALMATEAGIINFILARAANPTESIAAYSIYYRLVLFALQPVIATSVALLPYAARRAGALDFAGVRRGLAEANLAAALYSLVVVGPLLLWAAPWIARHVTESPVTTRFAIVAIRAVPLACLLGAPFLLCRPVFEALQRGRPGLVMALLRYVALTGPLAWLGLSAARQLGYAPLYGLIAGTLLAGAISSAVFYVWLRAEIPRLDPRRV